MRLADPWWLALLIFLPLVFFYLRQFQARIRYPHVQPFQRLRPSFRIHPRTTTAIFRTLALAFLIVALARPQSGKKMSEITSEGIDIFLALDTSLSMQALDFKVDNKPVDRLEIVKNVVSEFVEKRSADRLGLVVFGEEAYTQCPLTLDHPILIDFLQHIQIGMAGDATAIGSAIGTAVNRLKDLKSKSKVIILLTDGSNTAGQLSPLKAAEIAATMNIKVYTVGVGTTGQAPFLVDTLFGKQFVYQNVEFDEKTLKKIAEITKAKYYRATDTEELREIYDQIDRLEKTEAKLNEYTEYNEKFHVFSLLSLGLILLEILLGQTWLRILP